MIRAKSPVKPFHASVVFGNPDIQSGQPGRELVREIIDLYRESNNVVARKYLGKVRLFDEDVSNYPEKPAPHGLTPLRSTEIAAWLWEYALSIKKDDESSIPRH